ncbi:MAG TPA: ribonuclease R [Pirellulales bacterium]|jgi:ribonuclease R
MNQLELEQAVLEFIRRPNYKPVKPRVVAKKLGLDEDSFGQLKRAIKSLVKSGQIAYGQNHLLVNVEKSPAGSVSEKQRGLPGNQSSNEKTQNKSPEKPRQQSPEDASTESPDDAPDEPPPIGRQSRKEFSGERMTGVFRRTGAGYGFVRPMGVRTADRSGDVFIAANLAMDAASGDTVLVAISKKRDIRRPNPEGEIVEIVQRETRQFVGTYFEASGNGYVQVDGTLFSRPVFAGDPGAKNAQPDDKVVFEMVRFPSHIHDGEGVITEVLGAKGAPGVDTLSIIREYNLPGEFPADVLEEARRQAEKFDESTAGRVDLTNETIITIDPIDARDFDDAISLEILPNGFWRLGVHIADVSHFVRSKSPLDREAYERATSVYLPDRVLPMLPEIVSNNLASLQPDKVRYTKTAFMEFSPEGIRTAVDLHTSAIRSKRRFTYEEVDEFNADPAAWREKLTPEVFALLGRMRELAALLRQRRFQRGSLELTMKEVKVDLDRQGRVIGAHVVENTESHQMIEAFMLAANEAVADTLQENGMLFLRRVHADPDPRKLKALTEFVAELGFQTGSLENRFELQKLLGSIHGRPEEHAVNYAVLRSLQRAIYSPIDEGHFALASKCYCHFTSPIRRYPDLTIHRLVEALIAKRKPHNDVAELVNQGEHCSEREQRAEGAERELTKLKLLIYMSSRIGEQLDGVVTGVEEFGLFVQGTRLPAEGLVHVTTLADDFYRFDRRSHTLTGNRTGNAFRLGDLVKVEVVRVDIDRRELDFRIVQKTGRRPPPPKPSKGGAKHLRALKSEGKKRQKQTDKQAKREKKRNKRR